MILGSHDTMSYLPPKHRWMIPFRFMAQCQRENYAEQYKDGARYFDLRIYFDKDGAVLFKHGLMKFKHSFMLPTSMLMHLDSIGRCTVRLILELDTLEMKFMSKKSIEFQEKMFKNYCKDVENTFRNITFNGGRRKGGWEVLYKFKTPDAPLMDMYSSMQGSKINGLWPWRWAKKYNQKIYNNNIYSDKPGFLLMDFIDSLIVPMSSTTI